MNFSGLPCVVPIITCGEVSRPFKAKAEGYSYGLGFNLAYGIDPWFGVWNYAYVYNNGETADDEIESLSSGIRVGRVWDVSRELLISSYLAVDYLEVDQVVNGVTELRNVFPDGGDLKVRYRIDQSNEDNWSTGLGMTFGLRRGVGVNAEATFAGDSYRLMVGAYYRF